jgi:hypothetical protein
MAGPVREGLRLLEEVLDLMEKIGLCVPPWVEPGKKPLTREAEVIEWQTQRGDRSLWRLI